LPAPTSSTPRCTKLLELIHVNICGPFPVATPHGKLYFVLFLDDASSVVNLQNLALRSDVRDAWRILRAKWELKTGRKVLYYFDQMFTILGKFSRRDGRNFFF